MDKIEMLLYTAKAHTTGGRDGASKTSDGRLDVKLASPGTSAAGTNPEQLFAAGWSACFMSALALVASQKKIPLSPERYIDAEVDLGTNEGGYVLCGRLNVHLPGVDQETARGLVEAAHGVCPYSKATRGNIEVELNVI